MNQCESCGTPQPMEALRLITVERNGEECYHVLCISCADWPEEYDDDDV